MAEKKKAMQKKGTTDLALPMDEMEALAGQGLENLTMDDVAVPYLKVVQKMSHEVDADHPSYVKGVEVGDFFNTATKQNYGKEVSVVPCAYSRIMIEWEDLNFKGVHDPSDPICDTTEPDEKGRPHLPNGNRLSDTRQHWVEILNGDGTSSPAILSLSSTQIKKSKAWVSAMQALKIERGDGTTFQAPMFSHSYRLSTVPEANAEGTWRGLKVVLEGPLTSEQFDVFQRAQEFSNQVRSGEAKAANPDSEIRDVTPEDSRGM